MEVEMNEEYEKGDNPWVQPPHLSTFFDFIKFFPRLHSILALIKSNTKIVTTGKMSFL